VLETSLQEHLFGQHIARDVVIHAIKAHFRERTPKKALVLSFNGLTGSGKTFVSQFIIKSLYKSGIKSKHAHFFSGRNHFALDRKAEIYKVNIYPPFFTLGHVQIYVVVKT
jgi:Cdc6-like AAA superfamily ATPase